MTSFFLSSFYPDLPEFAVVPVETLVEEGFNNTETHNDAVVTVSSGATVDTNAVITSVGGFADQWKFVSADPNIATVDPVLGNISRVSDGTARIIATDGKSKVQYRATVSREDPADITILQYWVSETLAKYSDDKVEEITDGVTPGYETRDLYLSGGGRNMEVFCSAYTQALTAVAKRNSTYGTHIGITAITRRHALGCAHAIIPTGQTVTWETASGVEVSRTITHSITLPPVGDLLSDLQLYLFDSDLPVTITPMRLPPTDLADYLCNPQLGVPVLFTDRDNVASVALTRGVSTQFFAIVPPTGDLFSFYTRPVEGTSGHRTMIPYSSESLMLLGTFTTSGGGSTCYARDVAGSISELDASAGISTGYTPTIADLSSFLNFSA